MPVSGSIAHTTPDTSPLQVPIGERYMHTESASTAGESVTIHKRFVADEAFPGRGWITLNVRQHEYLADPDATRANRRSTEPRWMDSRRMGMGRIELSQPYLTGSRTRSAARPFSVDSRLVM